MKASSFRNNWKKIVRAAPKYTPIVERLFDVRVILCNGKRYSVQSPTVHISKSVS